MKTRRPALLLLGLICLPNLAAAQGPVVAVPAASSEVAPAPVVAAAPPSLFRPLAGDFKRFFQKDTAQTVGLFALGALAVSPFDQPIVRSVELNGGHQVFSTGRVAGMFYVQAGAGMSTYFLGRAFGNNTAAKVGSEIFRAQVLSQTVVVAGKVLTNRQRPDESNAHSMPSGHTATGFATAGVLHRNFGWKVGVPAYAFAAYIGASRIDANRHHLSDVVLGAGIGLLSARAVSFPVGSRKFNVSLTPAPGGAGVSFTLAK